MDRQAEILRAAREIAVAEGMGEISVRNVAARAGIGASTLRHYFPTQHQLLDAVTGDVFDAQLEDLRIHDSSIPPAIRLTECMQQFLPSTAAEVPQLEGWLASYTAMGRHSSGQDSAVLATLSRQGRGRVTQWLSILDSEGVLRLRGAAQAATILLAVVNGLALELLTPGTPESVDTVGQALTQVIHGTVIETRQ